MSTENRSQPRSKILWKTRVEEEEYFAKMYREQMDALARKEKNRYIELAKTNALCTVGKLSKEQEKQFVNRVYDESVSIREQNYQKAIENRNKAETIKTKKITDDNIEEYVQRMYYNETTKKISTNKNLQSKYQPEPKTNKLSRKHQQEIVDRLCQDKREEIRQQLFEKYVVPTDPKVVRIGGDVVTEMANRLCTTKK
eukprot:Tbor_TRINITY_DN5648_c1_g6::TRINITY_DN5648_c1_g6_i3::g.8702::m.8702